ncbi:MAG: hypothetical protein IKN38_00690 [Clostridia bacterium]|nr:hypothetical protein [Clostridia bacterium]
MLEKKIRELLNEINETVSDAREDATLPQNTFFLKDEKILALPRQYGESRYPYDEDGYVVWAYQNGFIFAVDSLFTIFRQSNYGEEPVVNFFAGVERGNGEYFPISILGGARSLYEPEDVKRYTVFSPRCVYYIADLDEYTFSARMSVGSDKRINFAVTADNKTDSDKKIYLAHFIEALLRFMEGEGFWDRMSKFGEIFGEDIVLWSRNGKCDCLSVTSCETHGKADMAVRSVSRNAFLGYKGRNVSSAESLKRGEFDRYIPFVNTTDLPAACAYYHYTVPAGDSVRLDFSLELHRGVDDVKSVKVTPADPDFADREIEEREAADERTFDNVKFSFDDFEGINPRVLERFTRCVQKQTSFCALGKNYAGPNLGFRDVLQQLEGSLMWDPENSREKIVRAMNYMMTNGRVPRQFSIPASADEMPDFDLRMYIDQGVWAISAIYTYVCFTGDYSILDEVCGYYTPSDDKWAVRLSDERDTVFEHLLRIADFFIENLACDTGCVRILYGDWNDALDGLGKTDDADRKYGDGVSVMTTLQFYQNLEELIDLIRHTGKFTDKAEYFSKIRESIAESLEQYAVDKSGKGRRVIHGWGDKRSYFVGSSCDYDGAARYSLTANTFWMISGMIKRDPSMREALVACADAVDSKYGLMTFDVPFKLADRPFIGRLATITKGTYENCCAYVHAGMFGVMGLFLIGESRRAWDGMKKLLVVTHDNCTMTSFVMPNSYCRNEELYIDGVSMGDWYTGSGTMYVKELVKYGFGIAPDLDGLKVQTPAYMPSSACGIDIRVKGKKVSLCYRNEKSGTRRFFVDGKEASSEYDDIMRIPTLYVPASDLRDGMKIEVVD